VLALLALASVLLAATGTPPVVRLVDVAEQAGLTLRNLCGEATKDYIVEVNGNGAAFFDHDNDGDMDVLIVNGSTLRTIERGGDPIAALYENDGKGRFRDVTERSGLDKRGWGMGVCAADYDNDGFQDLYVTAHGPNTLFRNNGDGTFADVTAKAGVGDPRWSTGCAFGDYDRDGDLDLYVANYLTFDVKKVPRRGASPSCKFMGIDVMCGPRGLPGEPDALYQNNGDGTFRDVTEAAGIRDPGYYGFGVVFTDVDDDGWPDIYVANDSVPNFLFRNNRNGTFSEIGLVAGVALSEAGKEQAGMGVDAGDYNNDGRFDLFVTNFSHDSNTLYRNDGQAFFSDVTFPAGLGESSLPYLGWGTAFVDLDNDGLRDIFVANGHVYPEIDAHALGTKYLQRKLVYRNLGDGRFREASEEIGGDVLLERSSRGAAVGDYDNDGDPDVLVVNLNDRPSLLRNDGGNGNHWLTFRLVGTRSNRDAVGARLVLTVAGRTHHAEVRSGGSYLSHNDMRVHFGLGQATAAARLEIRWPSGLVEKFQDLGADQFLLVKEGEGLRPLQAGGRN